MLSGPLSVASFLIDKVFVKRSTLSVFSPRHDWIIEHFGRPIWAALRPLFEALHSAGLLGGAPPALAYVSLIGSALITFGNPAPVADFSGETAEGDAWVTPAIDHILRPIFEPASLPHRTDWAAVDFNITCDTVLS